MPGLFGGLRREKRRARRLMGGLEPPGPAQDTVLGGSSALPWKRPAPLLGASPAKALRREFGRTPGLFTVSGVSYGEEEMSRPPEERVPLSPEEIERRRKQHRRETLMTGAA